MTHNEPRHPALDRGKQLIIGAGGGIGLAMVVHQLSQTRETQLVAVGRGVCEHPALLAHQAQYPDRLQLLNADVTKPDHIQALADALEANSLSLVVNAVGLLHDQGRGLRPEKRLEDITLDGLEHIMRVNAWSTALLMPALFPKMVTNQTAVFAALSARVGSIADNRIGGWYAYRASKAALNQLIKTASIEAKRRYPNLILASLHPGTTDTALSKPFQANVPAEKLFEPSFVAKALLGVIEGLSDQDSGGFFAWDGQAIPF